MSGGESILAGWLVDGSGEPTKENVMLTVKGGRIDRIETTPPQAIPRNNFSDFSHCTLLPGLIDAHVHLFMSGTEDLDIRENQLNLAFDDVKEGIQRRIGSLLTCGVVACRDGGDRQAFTMRYKRDHLARDHFPIDIKVAGSAWHRKGRYGKMIGRAIDEKENLTDCIIAESRFVDHIKIVNSGLNSLLHFGNETLPQFDSGALKEAVAAGKRMGCKTMVHANGKKPVEAALKAGCHSIEHGFFMGENNLKLMADRQIFWVPTAVTMKAYQETMCRRIQDLTSPVSSTDPNVSQFKQMSRGAMRNLDHQLEQICLAKTLGVPIAVGTDSGSPGVYHGPSLSREIRLLTAAGFTLEESLRCACANNAHLLDLQHSGRLAKGMDATFIAVNGPPDHLLENLTSPEAVVIKGREYPLRNVSTG